MHMADALVSPVVGGVMLAVSTGTIGYSIKKITKDEMDDKKVPLMGIMGAFVFAAQMINFTIPGTGSSGHIGGGILLAALLGPVPRIFDLIRCADHTVIVFLRTAVYLLWDVISLIWVLWLVL